MNNLEALKWIVIGLTIILFIVIIVLLVFNLIKNNKDNTVNKDNKKEFITDMNNLNGPLYDIIKKQKNYDEIVSYIYNNNKEQINAVYNNNNTKGEFIDLIDSNCLHNEVMYKILVILDKKILETLDVVTRKSKGPDHVKGVIIMFLSIVYLHQGLQEITSGINSKSKPEDLSSLQKMCSILACNSKKETLLTIRQESIPTTFLTQNLLYNKDTGDIFKNNFPKHPKYPKMNKIHDLIELVGKMITFIKVFNNNIAVNHKFFDDYNKNTIIPLLNKMKLNLEQTVCEKDSGKSSYNASHNLFNVINNDLAKILIEEIFNIPNLLPGFNPLGPAGPA